MTCLLHRLLIGLGGLAVFDVLLDSLPFAALRSELPSQYESSTKAHHGIRSIGCIAAKEFASDLLQLRL